LRDLYRLGGLIDAEIIDDREVLDHFEIAAADIENRGGRLNALLPEELPLNKEIVAARADPRTSFAKMPIAQVPEDAIVESVSDLRIGFCDCSLRCRVKMGLRLQEAENVETGAMIVQQGDWLGVIEIAMGTVEMNIVIESTAPP
jgi:hypothetical protein